MVLGKTFLIKLIEILGCFTVLPVYCKDDVFEIK